LICDYKDCKIICKIKYWLFYQIEKANDYAYNKRIDLWFVLVIWDGINLRYNWGFTDGKLGLHKNTFLLSLWILFWCISRFVMWWSHQQGVVMQNQILPKLMFDHFTKPIHELPLSCPWDVPCRNTIYVTSMPLGNASCT